MAILGRLSPYAFHLLRRTPLVGDAMLRVIDILLPPHTLIATRVRAGPLEGLAMHVYPHALDMAIGRHEPLVGDLIRRHLSEGDIAFDIGANVGYFALLMARCVGTSGHVVAFEADPLVGEYLRRNVARNQGQIEASIEAVSMAIAGRSGSRPFMPGSRLSRGKIGSGSGPVTVNAMTLGDAVDRYGSPRLIKIDVEGAEAEILEGAVESLATLGSTIIIEAHSQLLERRCLQILRECGFHCERLLQRGTRETYILATK